MKRNLFLSVTFLLFLLGLSLHAEYKEKPDNNTLWVETCQEVKVGPPENMDVWRNNQVDFEEVEQGLKITGYNAADEKISTGRWVALDKDYPYIVLDIAGTKNNDGYRGMTFWILEHNAPPSGFGTNLKAGMFIWPAISKLFTLKEDMKSGFFRLDLHNSSILLRSIKMVKKPEYNIQLIPENNNKEEIVPGDKITFRVTMPDKAEDVTINLSQGDPTKRLSLNGKTTIQLKPVPGNLKVWETKITFKTLEGFPETTIKPGGILIRALPLGEKLSKAIWTTNTLPIKTSK